jgi:hypothetical protein
MNGQDCSHFGCEAHLIDDVGDIGDAVRWFFLWWCCCCCSDYTRCNGIVEDWQPVYQQEAMATRMPTMKAIGNGDGDPVIAEVTAWEMWSVSELPDMQSALSM